MWALPVFLYVLSPSYVVSLHRWWAPTKRCLILFCSIHCFKLLRMGGIRLGPLMLYWTKIIDVSVLRMFQEYKNMPTSHDTHTPELHPQWHWKYTIFLNFVFCTLSYHKLFYPGTGLFDKKMSSMFWYFIDIINQWPPLSFPIIITHWLLTE